MQENEEMLSAQVCDEPSHQAETMKKKQNKKKFATTIYLTEEAEQAFLELYIHRLRKDRKTDKSLIACQAILELYEKECKQSSKVHTALTNR